MRRRTFGVLAPNIRRLSASEDLAMMNDTQRAATPDIELVVKKIESENIRYQANERRSVHRIPLARPVSVLCSNSGDNFPAYSQNISNAGIALLSQGAFKEGQMAVLQVHSIEGPPYHILSECRWCRPYGTGWYNSGWMFHATVRRQG